MFLSLLQQSIRLGFVTCSCIAIVAPLGAVGVGAVPFPTPVHLAQASATSQAGSRLLALPRPTGAPAKLNLMFGANAYDQQMLNFQYRSKPESACGFYQQQLAAKGYQERKLNTVIGQWGCNLVFDPPTPLTAKNAGKSVVLVIQSTMLAPETININARFEEI